LLDNNLELEISDGKVSHTTSTSVDVVGFCAVEDRGECHDCKVRSREFDMDWLKELVDNVAPFGFRIGAATADSITVAKRRINAGSGALLVCPDTWGVLPLQV
jgi:hypothetical protein